MNFLIFFCFFCAGAFIFEHTRYVMACAERDDLQLRLDHVRKVMDRYPND